LLIALTNLKLNYKTELETKKIVLIGAECSGKTSLIQLLAKYFKAVWNPEYVRLYLDLRNKNGLNSNYHLPYEDVSQIATGQIITENILSNQFFPFIFLDTNILLTKIYSQHYFGKYPKWIDGEIQRRKYDFYLYSKPLPCWEDDPQRGTRQDQKLVDRIIQKTLEVENIPFQTLEGSINERLELAVAAIEDIVKP